MIFLHLNLKNDSVPHSFLGIRKSQTKIRCYKFFKFDLPPIPEHRSLSV